MKYLNAFDAARKAFIEAGSNKKLRCALKANNRVTAGLTKLEILFITSVRIHISGRVPEKLLTRRISRS